MKNRFLLASIVAFLFLFMSPTFAQIGIKGGFLVSDIAFQKYGQEPYLGYEIGFLDHRKPLYSFEVGAAAIFDLSKRFDFQPELLYALQGLNYSTDYLYDNITYKVNINYLKIPLLFRYKVCMKEKKRSGVYAGPYTSFNLKAVRVIELEGEKDKTDMSNVKDIDFGVVAGYSLDLDLPSGQMIVDLRFGYSLINTMTPIDGNIPWYYGPSNEYVRNITISLTAGYRFLNIWSKKAEKQ